MQWSGVEWKASPFTTLTMQSGTSSFMQMGTVSTSIVIQTVCIPTRMIFVHIITNIDGLVNQLRGKQNALAELDSLFKDMSKHFIHHSDCNFPHMSFPIVLSNVSQATDDETDVHLIVIVIVIVIF